MDLPTETKNEFGTILSEFGQQVKLNPDKPAIIEGHQTLTFRQLQMQSIIFSRKLGFDSNEFVAILLPVGIDYVVSALAVIGSSKIYCTLSVDFPSVKLHQILQELNNPPLITKAEILKSIGMTYDKTHLLDAEKPVETEATVEAVTSIENETAGVHFTSGSTGEPKASLIGNRALVRCVMNKAERLNIGPNDQTVCVLNASSALSMTDTLNLLVGVTIHIPPTNLRYDMQKLREWVKSIGTVTLIWMVSSSGESFYQADPEDFSPCFRFLVLAGEKLQTRPPPGLPFLVYSDYGSTETLAVAIARIDSVSHLLNPITHTLVGTALKDVEIYILNEETFLPSPIGEIDEIAIGGPCLSTGYFNAPDQTKKKFIKLQNGVRVCMMGDLGYIQNDGNLVVLNRRDNQIKVAGNRFDLADLETALLQYNGVEKTIAVVEKGEDLKFHLFYKLKDGTDAEPESEQISEFLQDRLPHYAFPHSVTKVRQFCRNSNGKIDKGALLEIKNLKQKFIHSGVNETEQTLVEIWSNVLGIDIDKISRNDNFFSLGGNSSAVAKVVYQIQEQHFEVQIEPFHIFKIPVLKNLAAYLENNSQMPSAQIDLAAEVNSIPLELAGIQNLTSLDITKKASAILLTGMTGYLGGGLLFELLTQTDADLYCLIRARSENIARIQLDGFYKELNEDVKSMYSSRVHLIHGNISEPILGLVETEYGSLAGIIDQIFHCAAEVNWLKRYEELKAPNVLGTLEIIKFASTKKLKFLNYISTVGVLDLNAEAKIWEESRNTAEDPTCGTGYAQSKWVAEKLVWKAIEAGLPGIVYRPGIIGSHSKCKKFNRNDFITHLFRACKVVGAFPEFLWEFPYGTLNFTVNVIIAISQNPELNGNGSEVFHTFQNVLKFENFYKSFTLNQLKQVSMTEWKRMIILASDDEFHPDSDAVRMIKLFLSIPYYNDLTIFDLTVSKLSNNISNRETMKFAAHGNCMSELEQITNLVDSILQV